MASKPGASDCTRPRTLHTIGHSTRSIGDFVGLLAAHAIEMLIDVRRWPASRRYPHFHREALSTALREAGFGYLWRGDLGGFRKPVPDSPNTAWKAGAFRAYADFMLTDEFASIMVAMEKLAAKSRIALMCAEAVPWRCHRQLIADAFLVRGWSVRHAIDERCHEHKFPPFAKPDGTRIYYSSRIAQLQII